MRLVFAGILAIGSAGTVWAQQPPATPAPAGAPQAPLEVTLAEAIQRALQVQPDMIQARGDRRNAGSQLLAANGSFLPTVSAGGSYGRAGGTRLNSQTNQIVTAPATTTFQGNVGASLELFDGFRRFAERNSARASIESSDAGVTNQRYQVTLSTKQIFYAALAREELVRVAQSQVRRAQQQLQISVEKLRAGSATRSDSLRSTVDYGNARIALLEAQANLASAQANLGRQIGVEQSVRAVADSTLPALPDTSALRAFAVDRSPQVELAEAEARAAGSQVSVARAQYFPSITGSVGNSYSGSVAPWTTTQGYLSGWSARIALQWTLFNGFTRERGVTSASVSRDIAQARAADARRQAGAEYTQQTAALATAFEKITIARENVAAATEDLRVQGERYRVGAATILDLLTSQEALTTAETNLVQARFDYLIARAQLEALLGRTL